MDIQVGNDIKGYELRERIGAGGFGAVYRAYQSTVGREVAIKFILPGFSNQPDFIRRFETEAQLVARLEHPHITPLYDYWRDPNGAYLVMRWLRGGSLREALQNNPFDLRSAALLLDQIGGALWLAHRAGVIHRDLKPGNILLDEDGNAYLADFGIAKDLKVQGNNTQPDAVVGSLDYISPEQARSEPVTPRTDIYSLGVVLYEMLAGHHPFENMSAIERLYKHISDPLPELAGLDASIEDAVNQVIQKATAKNPDHRYADALVMAADFREAAGLNRTATGQTVEALLTPREHEILGLVIEGRSNKEIAQHLTVTLGTVKWYVNQIYNKLHVRSRVQAIIRARELNLIGGSSNDSARQAISSVSNLPEPENPYKGLRAFQAADEQDFFGRDDLTHQLVKRLGEVGISTSQPASETNFARFLAVIGPSGSGKSSLVKAGLIPAIWRGDLPGSEKWFVVEMLPGSHPLDKLEVALMKVAVNQSGSLNEQLARDKRGLLRASELILPDDGSELLLVIDQFEEVFTLVEDETERQHFLDLLVAAIKESRSRIRIVITLRADFYDRPLNYPEFGELVRSQMETVMPLSAKGLERAIAGPAERVGIKFEPGLVSEMVAEMNYQAGALPLLQYALTELFERREGRLLTHKVYQEIGGAGGALAKRAEELYLDLSPEGQEAARQMFMRLVTLGEGVEDTRRRTARSELLAIALETDVIDDLIDTYANYRLLSLDNDPATRTPTVELAHEAILREWERLRSWLNDSREDIRLERQLMTLAAEWEAARQDSSFLMHGARLETFEKWLGGTNLSLTPGERTYLQTSLAQREKDQVSEAERQVRESRLERRSILFLRGLVAVLLLAALGAFTLTGVAVNQSNIAAHSAAEAQNVALTAGSQAALANNNTDLAIVLALHAVMLDPNSARAQVAFGQAVYAPGTIRQLLGHADGVNTVAYSPDGRTVLSGSNDKTLILWDVETGQIIRRFEGHTDGVTTVTYSPDGRTALSGSGDKTLILWDVGTGQVIRRFEGHTDAVFSVAFSADGRTVLSGSGDKTLILWEVETGQIIRRFEGHTGAIYAVAFSHDGRTALSGSGDRTLILWDMETGQIIRHFETTNGHTASVSSVAISPDGQTALSSANESTAILWDIATGKVIRRFDGGQGWINVVRFSPDDRRALTIGADGTLVLWSLDTFQIISRFQGHTSFGLDVAFSPDGHRAISASYDHSLRLWDLEGGQVMRHFALHKDWVTTIAFSPDGRKALSSSWDGSTVLWDVQTGNELYQVNDTEQMGSSRFSPDGHTALIAMGDFSTKPSDIIVLDVDTGKEIRRLAGHPTGVMYADFSPDGRMAISIGGAIGASSVVILWDMTTGQEVRRFPAYENDNTLDYGGAATFSPDGRTVLTGFSNGTIILWDVATAQEIRRFVGHTNIVSSLLFRPDGRTFVSGSLDNTVILWEVATGNIIHRMADHSASIPRVVLSPDGRFAFAGSNDHTSTLWDLNTGQVVRRFVLPKTNSAADFSPDGHSILAGFQDGSVQLWHIDSQDELLTWTHANRYIPELTCEQRTLYQLEPLCSEDTVSS